MADVSIIIRTRDEARFIGATLEALKAQKAPCAQEIIVVDSGSSDRTTEIVQEAGARLLRIPTEIFSFGRALNYGAAASTGTILINLSAHCRPLADSWLERLTAPILRGEADATFGKQVPLRGLNPIEEGGISKIFHDDIHFARERPPFSNANCAFLRGLWKLFPFDETITAWEDFLWYSQISQEYRVAYVADAAVYHSHPLVSNYWMRRSKSDAQAIWDLKVRFGINILDGKTAFRHIVRNYVADTFMVMKYLGSNHYWKYMLVTPIFKLLTHGAFYFGLKEAMRTGGTGEREPERQNAMI
ncbi:glycosyltransferase, group 2 family protein [delta proteobacterium NaphS2]|nr:glycosyltransferase, group 2 family protein [delta proteobacterium NaphS2]